MINESREGNDEKCGMIKAISYLFSVHRDIEWRKMSDEERNEVNTRNIGLLCR